MGKPKYYEGQILEHRITKELYAIHGISDSISGLFFIRPIQDMGKQYTPNEGVISMHCGYSQVNRIFKIPPKRNRIDKEKTLKVLYGKIQKG